MTRPPAYSGYTILCRQIVGRLSHVAGGSCQGRTSLMDVCRPARAGLFAALVMIALNTATDTATAQTDENGDGAGGAPMMQVVVEALHLAPTVSLGGTVVPYREATLSAQMPGRVEVLAGEEGDEFEKDGLLVALDDDELLAKRQQVVADLKNAEAAMRNAGVQYSRELYSPYSINKAPGGMGLPSMMDYFFTRQFSDAMGNSNQKLDRHADLYKQSTRLEQSRNSILQARSRLREIDAKLRDTRSYAPFHGVIVRKFVEVGDTVQPGQPLYKFADLQYLQIKVEVPARLVRGLRKGDYLQARLDVDSGLIDVRVAQIFPVADSERHTVTVKFDVPNDAPAAPGMYATVMVADPNAMERDLVVIPRAALLPQGSLPSVKVIDEQGETTLRLVRLGEELGDGRVAVISGLQPGEVVQLQRPFAAIKPSHEWGREPRQEPRPRTSTQVPATPGAHHEFPNASGFASRYREGRYREGRYHEDGLRKGGGYASARSAAQSWAGRYEGRYAGGNAGGNAGTEWGQGSNPAGNRAGAYQRYRSSGAPRITGDYGAAYRDSSRARAHDEAQYGALGNSAGGQALRQTPSQNPTYNPTGSNRYRSANRGADRFPSSGQGQPQAWQPTWPSRTDTRSTLDSSPWSVNGGSGSNMNPLPQSLPQSGAMRQASPWQAPTVPVWGDQQDGQSGGNASPASPLQGIDDNAAGLFGEQRGSRDGVVAQ